MLFAAAMAKKKSRKPTRLVQTRVTDDVYQAITMLADRSGDSVAAWTRKALTRVAMPLGAAEAAFFAEEVAEQQHDDKVVIVFLAASVALYAYVGLTSKAMDLAGVVLARPELQNDEFSSLRDSYKLAIARLAARNKLPA